MTTLTTAGRHDFNTLSNHVKTLINSDLKAICKAEGLPVSGVKSVLQTRILDLLNRFVSQNDSTSITRLRYRITHHGAAPDVQNPSQGSHSGSGYSYNPQSAVARNGPPYRSQHPSQLQFRNNPFYEIQEAVSATISCEPHQQTRTQKLLLVNLSEDVIRRLKSDREMRVYLYCASEPVAHPPLDIAFPGQVEVRVNGEEIKANYKGLKNKPGSTRPVDITAFLRKSAQTQNQLQFNYALTSKRYYIVAMLAKKRAVDYLVEKIKTRGVITKQQVVREMLAKASDPDIVATSTVMSLKDPLTLARIALPCRMTTCTHNQCFDAIPFLQLQETAPTWTCPICSKTGNWDSVSVDQYVEQILQEVPRTVDQVTIEPNGGWSFKPAEAKKDSGNGATTNGTNDGDDYDDSDDDLLEITNPRVSNIKSEAPATPFSMTTPYNGSREASITTSVANSASRAGQKRKSEVIDLTFSEDEDDQPVSNKRPQTIQTTINGQAGAGRDGYQVSNQSSQRPPSANGISFQMTRPQTAGFGQRNNSMSASPITFGLPARPPSNPHYLFGTPAPLSVRLDRTPSIPNSTSSYPGSVSDNEQNHQIRNQSLQQQNTSLSQMQTMQAQQLQDMQSLQNQQSRGQNHLPFGSAFTNNQSSNQNGDWW